MIKRTKEAFTLTEVLLAVAIVGIIAALVLPVIITKYQENVMEYMAKRQIQSITSALESLAITENKSRFGETTMGQGINDDDHTGKFLKKNLLVANYIGEFSSPTISEAFADEYYKYEEKDGSHKRTKVTRAQLDLKGSCAQLKNGISICITSQFGGVPTKVIMDLNGLKGPNIIGRDLIEWTNLPAINDYAPDRSSGAHPIIAENESPITPIQAPECTSITSDASTGCCKWKREHGMITGKSDVCCGNSAISGTLSACADKVEVHLNYYPTSLTSATRPWTKSSTTFYLKPAIAVDTFPSELGVKIRCSDGTYQGGVLSGTTIKSALKSNSDAHWPGTINKNSCVYPNEKLLWDNNGSTKYTVSGVTYELHQH